MEGILFIPPDRGTIIGRALWKSRYVVVGAARDTKDKLSKNNAAPAAQPWAATTRGPSVMPPEFMFLSIYKTKDDSDPVQQHAISSITDCQVQMIAHRKQGPVLPTLVVNISPDPITDKLRKRRSSRTAGLTTTKDTMPSTLWFRPGEDSHHSQKHILQEWCRFIQLLMQQLGTATTVTTVTSVTATAPVPTSAVTPAAPIPAPVSAVASAVASASASASGASTSGTSSAVTNSAGPLSPITPATPTFSNPFSATRHRDTSDASLHKQQSNNSRSDGDHHNIWPGGTKKQANQVTHGRDRDRPTAPSESPSLRSRRSDLSHTSSNVAPHALPPPNGFVMPMFPYRPAELPSPATTVAESPAESSDWAQAQGVSSSLSSPIRGRDSISSQPTQIPSKLGPGGAAPALASGSPPVPRETILDRAFQMRFIPGSGREVPGEEKLSSLARFDALMREAEERKRLRQAIAGPSMPPPTRSSTGATSRVAMEPRSGWDLDEDSEEDDEEDEDSEDSEDELDQTKAAAVEEDDEDDEDEGESDAVSDGDSLRAEWSQVKEEALNARAHQLDPAIRMTPKTLRALDFITNRRSAGGAIETAAAGGGGGGRRPISRTGTFSGDYDPQTLQMLNSGCHPSSAQPQQQLLRPQTGYARNRPAIAQRTHSQPQLAPLHIGSFTFMGKRYATHVSPSEHVISPLSPRSPPASFQTASPASDDFPTIPTSARLHRSVTSAATTPTTAAFSGNLSLTPSDRRQSTSSVKRLSFSEFTKRISNSSLAAKAADNGSTSTLSGPGGSGPASPVPMPGQALSRYTVPPPPPPPADRCVWRGSVGVLGNEGGFL